MNTLHIALAVLGAIVLAAVVAHGAWTSRKSLPKQADETLEPRTPAAKLPELTGDPLFDRIEPVMQTDAPSQAGEEFGSLPAPRREAELDPLIDVIAPIAIEAVVSGEAALAGLPSTRRVGTKPFAVEGLSAETGLWEALVAGQRYSAFQAGIQLANRIGPMNQIEFSEFISKAGHFADAVGGEPQFPDMLEEVARARELDQFAGQHDAQLSFTLRAREAAWSPGYLQQHAARLGFVPGVIPGRLVLPAQLDGHPPLLGLSFDSQAALAEAPERAALREITLWLDVPQVSRADRPFERLCEAALSLAKSMDGSITDDHGNPIDAQIMESIHADLQKLYDALELRDLPAGSALCRRLFS
jgi:hypothetical protein